MTLLFGRGKGDGTSFINVTVDMEKSKLLVEDTKLAYIMMVSLRHNAQDTSTTLKDNAKLACIMVVSVMMVR